MQHKTSYKLLTFYRFVDIKNPELEVANHLQFCADIGMKGRIYIGEEGISATVSGNIGQLQAYRAFLESNPYFQNIADVDIKSSKIKEHAFDKMIVRYRAEIVALGVHVTQKEVDEAYQKISVDEFKKIVDTQDPNYAILDMRNTYEYKLGHFKNAIPSGTNNFREVQDLTQKYMQHFADKKVIMYCTWGIRCEKLSALLKKDGITNFYALDGGVVKYVNTHNDGNREWNLYTFDWLISTTVGDKKTHTKIGECIYTGRKTDNAENCRYSPCNARIIATKKAFKKHMGFCSQECVDKAKQDLLIKTDLRIDPIDYKELRGQIKQGKVTFAQAQEQVTAQLDTRLAKTGFKHKTSQKEEIVDQGILDKYLPSCST